MYLYTYSYVLIKNCVQFLTSHKVNLDSHFHFYLWVGLVVTDNKVFKFEVINVSYFTSYF